MWETKERLLGPYHAQSRQWTAGRLAIESYEELQVYAGICRELTTVRVETIHVNPER
jgi:23S rRNA maturation-related 3'-5' exoribonuclease YhaM